MLTFPHAVEIFIDFFDAVLDNDFIGG